MREGRSCSVGGAEGSEKFHLLVGLLVTANSTAGVVLGVFGTLVPGGQSVTAVSQGPGGMWLDGLPGATGPLRNPAAGALLPEGVRTVEACGSRRGGRLSKGSTREVSGMMGNCIS